MPSWKSTKDGKHFQTNPNKQLTLGDFSSSNNNSTKHDQPSSIVNHDQNLQSMLKTAKQKSRKDKKIHEDPTSTTSYHDKESQEKFEKVLSLMNKDIDSFDIDTAKDIFGYFPELEHDIMIGDDFIYKADPGPERQKALGVAHDLVKIWATRNYDEFDKQYAATLKKYGAENKLIDRKIIAEAYNQHMDQKLADKNLIVSRFMKGDEFISMLRTGKFVSDNASKEYSLQQEGGNQVYKSFTANSDHKFSGEEVRVDVLASDYDMIPLRATGYPRASKSVRDGVNIRPYDLVQEELRLKDGTKFNSNMQITTWNTERPYCFLEYSYPTKTEEKNAAAEITRLLDERGITVTQKGI